jgi:tetratricopeptide (TPR) repeat protein
MDNNDQLTFSDDPMLTGINEVYQLIEDGNFNEAVKKLDGLMNSDPDYPGITEAYRTAKFWMNRAAEIENLGRGKQKADFLMREWEEFKKYSENFKMTETTAFTSVMKNIFFNASENYKIAFKDQESTTDNFNLLLNLGMCFLILKEYKASIDTLEYARSSNRNNAKLNSLLGEAYFHINEISRSLLFFKEAFFIDPSDIDLDPLKSKPIQDLIVVTKSRKSGCTDIREYMPVFGFTEDIFYTRRNVNTEQMEAIKREIYTLEKNLGLITREKAEETNIIPRLINKYLWMLDYFRFQKYDYENIVEIKNRLVQLDKEIFEDYFKAHEIK